MKRTWETEITEMGLDYLGGEVTIWDVLVECECDLDPGEPGDHWTPPCPPGVEIYDIKVIEILDYDGVTNVSLESECAHKLAAEFVQKHLIESKWHENKDILSQCLEELSVEEMHREQAAMEAQWESRRMDRE